MVSPTRLPPVPAPPVPPARQRGAEGWGARPPGDVPSVVGVTPPAEGEVRCAAWGDGARACVRRIVYSAGWVLGRLLLGHSWTRRTLLWILLLGSRRVCVSVELIGLVYCAGSGCEGGGKRLR